MVRDETIDILQCMLMCILEHMKLRVNVFL